MKHLVTEDRILFALVALVLSMGVFAAKAEAVTLSPEAQQLADAHDWEATDFEYEEPSVPGEAAVSCAHGRAKRIGFNYGPGQVRMSGRLKVCASNGRFTYIRCGPARHASPGPRWAHVYGPGMTKHGGGRDATCRFSMGWVFHGVIDSYFNGYVVISADLNRDHDVWFDRKGRHFG